MVDSSKFSTQLRVLICVFCVAGCNKVVDVDTDAAPVPDANATVDARGLATWGEPQLLGGINTQDSEQMPSLSADGLEIYFVSTRFDGSLDLFTAQRSSTTVPFLAPTRITQVQGTGSAFDPELSSDGTELYFCYDGELYFLTRGSPAATWSNIPMDLFPGYSPSLSGDGLTLYYIRADMTACGDQGTCVKKRVRDAVGDLWQEEQAVAIPQPYKYWSMDISDDETAILLSKRWSASYPPIMRGVRANRSATFDTLTTIDTLKTEWTVAGAVWNVDRTELYFNAVLPDGPGDHDIYVLYPQ